jgi:hypothetical protein
MRKIEYIYKCENANPLRHIKYIDPTIHLLNKMVPVIIFGNIFSLSYKPNQPHRVESFENLICYVLREVDVFKYIISVIIILLFFVFFIAELVTGLPLFLWNPRFIIVFTSARRWSLSRAS